MSAARAMASAPRARRTAEGVVYPSGARVTRALTEWRDSYPNTTHIRSTSGAPGETWYYSRTPLGNRHKLVAEVYAIVPEGK